VSLPFDPFVQINDVVMFPVLTPSVVHDLPNTSPAANVAGADVAMRANTAVATAPKVFIPLAFIYVVLALRV
jgi:hypothetical protein